MAGEVTVANLDGMFKDQFHKDIENTIPDHVILQKGMIQWVPSDKMNGEFYSVPTLLRSNQGVSYIGESGAVSTLKDAKSALMKEAQIKGSEINVRGQLSYKVLSQAATAGDRAFKKASAWLVEDLQQVAYTRLEIAALYGQVGLGTVASVGTPSGQDVDVVITEATFAPGIWVLLEGATFDSWSTNATPENGANELTLKSVATSTRTVKMTFIGASLGTQIAAGHEFYFEGARTSQTAFTEMCGLFKQFAATSGTLFNISRADFTLMQGNVVDVAGPISKAKLVDAAMRCVDKGCMSELTVLVGTRAWAALNKEDMALRRFDGSYASATSESGNSELIYHNVNGKLKVVCHPMVKGGDFLIFNPEEVLWVGSAKPTFEIPGMGGERFFRLVDGSNAVELQNYADLAIYALKPSQGVAGKGITY